MSFSSSPRCPCSRAAATFVPRSSFILRRTAIRSASVVVQISVERKIVSAFIEEAVRAEGSTQALASRLNAPQTTLIRWMTGHAQTPLRVFVAVLHFLMELEQKSAARLSLPDTSESGADGVLVFPLGPLQARCVRCDGVQFRPLGNRAVEESRQRIQRAARRQDSLRGKLPDDDSG